jgi:hypothetical protein
MDKLDPGLPMDTDEQLAQELNNPLARLITVPMQNNFDYGLWRNNEGFRYTLVAQLVLPSKLSDDWNLITRTVIPYASIERVFSITSPASGTPCRACRARRPMSWGLAWGVGPAILYPTATNRFTGVRQFRFG